MSIEKILEKQMMESGPIMLSLQSGTKILAIARITNESLNDACISVARPITGGLEEYSARFFDLRVVVNRSETG